MMHKLLEELIIYEDSEYYFAAGDKTEAKDLIKRVVELAYEHGLSGNIWHSYVAYYIAMAENAFSLSQENNSKVVSGSLKHLADQDLAILKSVFDYDFYLEEEELGVTSFPLLWDFEGPEKPKSDLGRRVEQLKDALEKSEDNAAFAKAVSDFYAKEGAGLLGLSKAFVVKTEGEYYELDPIKNLETVTLDDLIGYQVQKEKLVANTEAFLEKKPANNVLLYGDGGTGKSTSVRAIANRYAGEGLRMIQVYRHQMQHLNQIISQIKNRNYRFILYMDDLSFEDFETEYKYLKAVIEGGLAQRPENVLIYATSNRRHLIKETWKDRADLVQDGDMHQSDSKEEKLSLAERFGIQIYYGKPSIDEFHKIVEALADKENLKTDKETLHKEATKWEIRHGGVSGRSARQFIDYIKGTEDDIK